MMHFKVDPLVPILLSLVAAPVLILVAAMPILFKEPLPMTRAQDPVAVAFGTSAALAGVTPIVGELLWDTTNNRLFAGDGAAAGGKLVGGVGVVGVAATNTLYVGKHGSDSNDGKSFAQAFLTIGKAITEVSSPTAASPWAIRVIDAGVYDEGAETVPAFTHLFAPAATIRAQLTMSEQSFVEVRILVNASANPMIKHNVSGKIAIVRAMLLSQESGATGKMIDVSGSGSALHLTVNGIESLNSAGKIDIQIAAALFAEIGLWQATHASATAIDVDGDAWIQARRIEVLGASATALDISSTGKLRMRVEELKGGNIAYTVASGGTLRLSVAEISGTQTASGTVLVSQDGFGGDVGTAFPSTAVDGQRFYRTDFGEWFFYDSTRSKWLGETLIEVVAFGPTAQTTWLRATGDIGGAAVTYSATFGVIAIYDVAVVAMEVSCGGASTMTVGVQDDGATSTGATISLANAFNNHDSTINGATIAAGSVMGIKVTSGTANFPFVKAYARRVET